MECAERLPGAFAEVGMDPRMAAFALLVIAFAGTYIYIVVHFMIKFW